MESRHERKAMEGGASVNSSCYEFQDKPHPTHLDRVSQEQYRAQYFHKPASVLIDNGV